MALSNPLQPLARKEEPDASNHRVTSYGSGSASRDITTEASPPESHACQEVRHAPPYRDGSSRALVLAPRRTVQGTVDVEGALQGICGPCPHAGNRSMARGHQTRSALSTVVQAGGLLSLSFATGLHRVWLHSHFLSTRSTITLVGGMSHSAFHPRSLPTSVPSLAKGGRPARVELKGVREAEPIPEPVMAALGVAVRHQVGLDPLSSRHQDEGSSELTFWATKKARDGRKPPAGLPPPPQQHQQALGGANMRTSIRATSRVWRTSRRAPAGREPMPP